VATFSRRAILEWNGDMMDGACQVTAGTGAFAVPATFPSTAGEAAGKTTPEELVAASHATCYASACVHSSAAAADERGV
jgi:osmotically inducible protein OsmC